MITTFNGIAPPSWLIVSGVHRPATPPLSALTEAVPGRPGVYRMGRTEGARTISFNIAFVGTSMADARVKEAALVAWLTTDDPAALVLADDPTVAFTAEHTGAVDLEWKGTMRVGPLTFTCFDPYARDATEDETAIVVGDNTIANAGTLPVAPRFVVPFTADATFLKVAHPDGRYVMVGNPAAVTDTPLPPAVTALDLALSTVTGWDAGSKCEGGTVAGTMASDGNTFSPKHTGGSVGTGAGWHGPSRRKALSAPATDFSAILWCGVDNRTPASSLALVEMYLLDAAYNTLGVIRYGDKWATYPRNVVEVRAGGPTGTFKDLSAGLNPTDRVWTSTTDADEVVRRIGLRRVGNVWSATICRSSATLAATEATMRRSALWTDTAGVLAADITHVEVRVAGYSTYALTASCYAKHVTVNELNVVGASDIIHIAKTGDTIELLPDSREVLKNGERCMDRYDAAGSDWFDLAPGNTSVSVLTDGTISGARAYVRPAWR